MHYVSPPDIYTAVERGAMDGAWLPVPDHVSFGLIGVSKYFIDHGFGHDDMLVYLNLDTWNRIPGHLQDLLLKALIDQEAGYEPAYMEYFNQAREDVRDAGVQFIKFPPDEAEVYVRTMLDKEWEVIIERVPEIGPKMRELLTK